MRLTNRLAVGLFACVGVAQGSQILPLGSVSFTGVNGGMTATLTFTVFTEATIDMYPQINWGGLPNPPFCTSGFPCHNAAGGSFGVAGSGGWGTSGSIDMDIVIPGNSLSLDTYHWGETLDDFAPGTYTVVLGAWSLGDPIHGIAATNTVTLSGLILSGSVGAVSAATLAPLGADSTAPEPGTFALLFGALGIGVALSRKRCGHPLLPAAR